MCTFMFMAFDFPIRKIIHVDMDAFYASVEQLDNPELRGKPIAVGGDSDRGVVAAASYEARRFKVHSALPSVTAKRRCPHLIFVKPRFDRYKEVSDQIRAVFYEYTDLVEPLSLDEAFLDVTENKKGNPSATIIAHEIRALIKERTELNASAGISINKFLAKVASDINKPNGQKTINPEDVIQFLEQLPIEKFFGVGKVTAKKMHAIGIFNGAHLKVRSKESLERDFGKSGAHYYNIVRGIQNSEVKPNRTRKSIAAERTFMKNLSSELFVIEKLEAIADELERRMLTAQSKGKTITLKIKYSDFVQQTRSKTIDRFVNRKHDFFPIIEELVYQDVLKESVRLLGISISNLETGEEKQPLSVQLIIEF